LSFRCPEPILGNKRLSQSGQAPTSDRVRASQRARPNAATLLAAFIFSLTACTSVRHDTATRVVAAHHPELAGGVSHTFNYTPWYIHTFAIEGPSGSRIRGGGGNTMPMQEDGSPSEGGGMCCTSHPVEWQPDLKLTVRWKVDKKQDGKTPGTWYKAENVRIPEYDGQQAGGVWAIFLPGDQVKLMIADGNANGRNSVAVRPTENDAYIAQGMPDKEANWDDKLAEGGWLDRPVRPDDIGVGMSAQNFTATAVAFGVDGRATYDQLSVGSAHADGTPRKSGSNCCAALPPLWRSDHRTAVFWKRYDRSTRTVEWLRAELPIPAYEQLFAYDPHASLPAAKVWRKLWIQFLPGDRVHAVLGTDEPPPPPRDGDPYTVKATVLDQITRDPGIP
jgi:Protein of unknown function (DUF3304)